MVLADTSPVVHIHSHTIGAEYTDVAFQKLCFPVQLQVRPFDEKLRKTAWDREVLSRTLCQIESVFFIRAAQFANEPAVFFGTQNTGVNEERRFKGKERFRIEKTFQRLMKFM